MELNLEEERGIPHKEMLREMFIYSQVSGKLFWKVRPTSHFKSEAWCNHWNKKFAGKEAGGIHKTKNLVYRKIRINNVLHQAHRVIWVYFYGAIPDGMVIDHIDHNTLNNKIENLRCVTHYENSKNRRMSPRNKSGVTGVHWHKEANKWCAQITSPIEGKIILGRFDELFEAVCARKSAEISFGYHENHGDALNV